MNTVAFLILKGAKFCKPFDRLPLLWMLIFSFKKIHKSDIFLSCIFLDKDGSVLLRPGNTYQYKFEFELPQG